MLASRFYYEEFLVFVKVKNVRHIPNCVFLSTFPHLYSHISSHEPITVFICLPTTIHVLASVSDMTIL